jgi:hypothetical protein
LKCRSGTKRKCLYQFNPINSFTDMTKIAGGFKQPIAKLPENEKKIGHPAPKSCRNEEIIKLAASKKIGRKKA